MQMHDMLYVHARNSCHSGSPTSLLDIVKNLDRERFSPIVMCPSEGVLTERLAELGIRTVIRPCVELTRETMAQFVIDVTRLCRWLRKEHIALVHMNTVEWRPSILLASRIVGVPTIQHVRNASSVEGQNWTYRWVDRILCVSDDTGQPFRQNARFRHKTRTLYNAVDVQRYGDVTNHRSLERLEGRAIIGFVGNVWPQKGVDVLITAMPLILRRYPSAVLTVVGRDPSPSEEHLQQFKELADQLGVRNSVFFTGFRRDIPKWMRTFDVFAFPTRHETFGKVVIEAMAAACPVVASAVGGIPEIVVRPDLGTLIPPNDPAATAAAVLRYLDDPNMARRVGDAAAKHARACFGLGSMMDHLHALYNELLARTARKLHGN